LGGYDKGRRFVHDQQPYGVGCWSHNHRVSQWVNDDLGGVEGISERFGWKRRNNAE
jgi:hypothetical protein